MIFIIKMVLTIFLFFLSWNGFLAATLATLFNFLDRALEVDILEGSKLAQVQWDDKLCVLRWLGLRYDNWWLFIEV